MPSVKKNQTVVTQHSGVYCLDLGGWAGTFRRWENCWKEHKAKRVVVVTILPPRRSWVVGGVCSPSAGCVVKVLSHCHFGSRLRNHEVLKKLGLPQPITVLALTVARCPSSLLQSSTKRDSRAAAAAPISRAAKGSRRAPVPPRSR